MRDTIKQLVLVLVAGLLAIPCANWMLAGLRAYDGLVGVPIMLTEHAFAALFRFLVVNVVLIAMAIVVGKLSHRYTGALVFGLAWTLLARRGIPVDELLRHLDTFDLSARTVYLKFVIESIIWAVPAGMLVVALSKLTPNRYEHEDGPLASLSMRGVGLAFVLAIVLCWIVVRTDLKGQAVFGVMAACTVAAMATRLVWPTCNGSVLFVVPLLVAVVGYVSSSFIMADNPLLRVATGAVWPLARPMPIDFLGAGMFGIALGIGAARSFGHEEHHQQQTAKDSDTPVIRPATTRTQT